MTKTASPYNKSAPKPDNYSDIINLPRPISKTHPRMDKNTRAAQFAPYAALVGHRDLIAHEEKIASEKSNLDREVTTELSSEIIHELELAEEFENNENLTIEDLDFSQENPLDS